MGLTIKLFTSPKVKKPLYIRYEYIGHAPKNVKLQDKDRLKVLEFDKNIGMLETYYANYHQDTVSSYSSSRKCPISFNFSSH